MRLRPNCDSVREGIGRLSENDRFHEVNMDRLRRNGDQAPADSDGATRHHAGVVGLIAAGTMGHPAYVIDHHRRFGASRSGLIDNDSRGECLTRDAQAEGHE